MRKVEEEEQNRRAQCAREGADPRESSRTQPEGPEQANQPCPGAPQGLVLEGILAFPEPPWAPEQSKALHSHLPSSPPRASRGPSMKCRDWILCCCSVLFEEHPGEQQGFTACSLPHPEQPPSCSGTWHSHHRRSNSANNCSGQKTQSSQLS